MIVAIEDKVYTIFLKQRMWYMHLSDLTPDYALGLLENHPYISACT